MGRRLSLRREALTELTNDDLGAVAGGQISLLCLPPRTGYSALDCVRSLQDCVYTAIDCITRGMGCLTDGCA